MTPGRIGWLCVGLGAVGVAGSTVAALLSGSEAAVPALSLLAPAAAVLALAGSALALVAAQRSAPASAPAANGNLPKEALSGLQGIIRELGSLLQEERGKITTLQEICNAGMRDARTISTRVENLTEAALDAETRLAAGVAHAAESTLHARTALPDIVGMVQRGIGEAVASRLGVEAETSLQALRQVINQTEAQVSSLNGAAAAAHRDVAALTMAGKEIAVASATIVSRLGSAANQIEAAAAPLPAATASIVDAAGTIAASGSAFVAEAATLTASGQALQATAHALQAGGAGIEAAWKEAVGRIDASLAPLPDALAAVTSAANAVSEATSILGGEQTALGHAGDWLRHAAEALHARGEAMEAIGAGVIDRIDAAIAPLPDATWRINEAASGLRTAGDLLQTQASRVGEQADRVEQASLTLTSQLGEALAPLPAALTEARDTTLAMQHMAAALTGDVDALREAAAAAQTGAGAMTTAGAEMAACIAAALNPLPGVSEELATSTRQAAEAVTMLAAQAVTLTEIGQNLTIAAADLHAESAGLAAGGQATQDTVRHASELFRANGAEMQAASDRLIQLIGDAVAHVDAVLAEVPPSAALLTTAAEQGSRTLAAAAAALQQAEARLGNHAEKGELAAAMTQHAAETLTGTVEATTARLTILLDAIEAACTGLAGLGNLSAALEHAASGLTDQTCRLEAAGERVAAASDRLEAESSPRTASFDGQEWFGVVGRLQELVDRFSTTSLIQALQEVLPGMIAPVMQRLQDLRTGLEQTAAMLADERQQDEGLNTLAGLSADIGESVRRVQEALADHNGIWPRLQMSMSQVQAAAVAVVEAAARERIRPEQIDADAVPAQLTDTLHQLGELEAQSSALLLQGETPAEDALAGQAQELSSSLADNPPALLAGIDSATRRLRSVATVLAMTSDGMPLDVRAAK